MDRMNEIEMRLSELREALDAPEADLDALETEIRALKAEQAELKDKAEKRSALLEEVATTAKPVEQFEEIRTEDKKMTNEEVRNSKEYIDAFANYIKTGRDEECRALLTEIVGGTVPVPTFVEGRVRAAWEKNELTQYVRKTYLPGVIKVGFEASASGAEVHVEGDDPIDPEELILGIITLSPASVKKYVLVSDEALDLAGSEFLAYLYDEISYQIAKAVADALIGGIMTAGTVSTADAVAVPMIEANPGLGVIAQAIGQLSDTAANPIVVMNKATWAAFKAAQYDANFAADPFEGLPVVFNNTLPAYNSETTSGYIYAIVGDFGVGAQLNFPNGDEITFKYDDLSLAESDLVKIVGREYLAMGLVTPNAFVNIWNDTGDL